MSLQEDTRKALDRWYLGGDNASEVVMYAENLVKRLMNRVRATGRAAGSQEMQGSLALLQLLPVIQLNDQRDVTT